MCALTFEPLTEDELVFAIAQALGAPPRRLRVGIGDDAAVWKASSSQLSLLTTDMLIDGVHFRLAGTSPEALGRKALGQNLSDVAAMGGWPTVAVVALGLTAVTDEAWVREFYRGLAGLARRVRCAIAGGDIVRAPVALIGISVAGEVRRSRLRLRSGARRGDVIALTGPLGLAAAGLKILEAGAQCMIDSKHAQAVTDAYLAPEPRLREGRFLASRRATRAMMDVSDGLSTDLARMAAASGVDAVIEESALAAAPPVAAAAKALGGAALDLVLHGGDDYELLVAVAPRAFQHLAKGYRQRFGRRLEAVGHFENGSGKVWIAAGGERRPLPAGGYDHLRNMRPSSHSF